MGIGIIMLLASVSDLAAWAKSAEPVAVQVSLGRAHVCALYSDGKVFCKGDNSLGQLGVSPRKIPRSDSPVAVPLLEGGRALELVSGDFFSCVRTQGRSIQCWGQLLPSAKKGVRVIFAQATSLMGVGWRAPLQKVVRIVAGQSHACALSANHQVYCWGENHQGQLGTNGRSVAFSGQVDAQLVRAVRLGIVEKEIFDGVADLYATGNTTCALRWGGERVPRPQLFCWGDGLGKVAYRGNQNQGNVMAPWSDEKNHSILYPAGPEARLQFVPVQTPRGVCRIQYPTGGAYGELICDAGVIPSNTREATPWKFSKLPPACCQKVVVLDEKNILLASNGGDLRRLSVEKGVLGKLRGTQKSFLNFDVKNGFLSQKKRFCGVSNGRVHCDLKWTPSGPLTLREEAMR